MSDSAGIAFVEAKVQRVPVRITNKACMTTLDAVSVSPWKNLTMPAAAGFLSTAVSVMSAQFLDVPVGHGEQFRVLVRATDGLGNTRVSSSNCMAGDYTASAIAFTPVLAPRVALDGDQRIVLEPEDPTKPYSMNVTFNVTNDVAPTEYVSACWGSIPVSVNMKRQAGLTVIFKLESSNCLFLERGTAEHLVQYSSFVMACNLKCGSAAQAVSGLLDSAAGGCSPLLAVACWCLAASSWQLAGHLRSPVGEHPMVRRSQLCS